MLAQHARSVKDESVRLTAEAQAALISGDRELAARIQLQANEMKQKVAAAEAEAEAAGMQVRCAGCFLVI